MKHVPISIVDVWFSGSVVLGSNDDAEIPLCCHPPPEASPEAVQWTFKLQCISECVPTAAPGDRRLEETVEEKSAEEFASLAAAHMQKPYHAGEAAKKAQDGHFCNASDYPCGESDGMVNVCHYSAKEGYQTYCVPEPDSDVLGYYPKDYCGPCVGGYRAYAG